MKYRQTSAHLSTPITDFYLDTMENRSIPKLADDVLFTINATYDKRPDLLAYDLYNSADLWWVFAMRNPNILVNPLIDFKLGTAIKLPHIDTLRSVLGI